VCHRVHLFCGKNGEKTRGTLLPVSDGFGPGTTASRTLSRELLLHIMPRVSLVWKYTCGIFAYESFLCSGWLHILSILNITCHFFILLVGSSAKDCPTADNIMVNVDLSLTFRIGPDIDAARNFVYRLGAGRLNDLLCSVTEESIRGLVYSVTHDKVNDLREDFALGMLSTLNQKTAQYGIQIMNVKITEVILPRELWQRLERTTAFKTKLDEQEKTHENRVKQLNDSHFTTIQTIEKENARAVQNIKAAQKRFEIQRRENEDKASGDARVKEVTAASNADVAMRAALGNEKASMTMARQSAEAILKKVEVDCHKMKVDAQQKARVDVKESQAQLKVSESNAEAMLAKAEAEELGAKELAEKRKYDLEWTRIDVLKKFAEKEGRKLFITGSKGQGIMQDLVPASKSFTT